MLAHLSVYVIHNQSIHHDVWSLCIFSSVFKTASKIIIHPTFFYLLTEEVYFALSVNIYIVSSLPFWVNCYQEPHELLLLLITPSILITTSFICMTIQTHTVLQKLCLGIKITTQAIMLLWQWFVTNIKTSWNIFYELYIDKVISRVHQFIDQTVYR